MKFTPIVVALARSLRAMQVGRIFFMVHSLFRPRLTQIQLWHSMFNAMANFVVAAVRVPPVTMLDSAPIWVLISVRIFVPIVDPRFMVTLWRYVLSIRLLGCLFVLFMVLSLVVARGKSEI